MAWTYPLRMFEKFSVGFFDVSPTNLSKENRSLQSKSDQEVDYKGKLYDVDFKIVRWGPQETTISTNPNIQPDGGMGVWIESTGTTGFGNAEVIFDGQPALSTSVQKKLVTASISAKQLK